MSASHKHTLFSYQRYVHYRTDPFEFSAYYLIQVLEIKSSTLWL